MKREHVKINKILCQIENCMKERKVNHFEALKGLVDLKSIWDEHEFKEEGLFSFFEGFGRPFPVESMFLEQHRQLKGHWKILQEAINLQNWEKFEIALNTDGRMLIDKFREHIKAEEDFFNMFVIDVESKSR